MAESFGARLRHQRERQQIALTFIAEQTKISLSLLEGLERDDVSQWPTGIFRRSFIRDYARLIGLEPDPIVREFLEIHPDHVEVVPEEPIVVDSANQRPPMRLRYLLASALSTIRARLHGVQPHDPDRDTEGIHHVVQARAVVSTAPAAEPQLAGPPAAEPPSPAVMETLREEPELSPIEQFCSDLEQADGWDVDQTLELAMRTLDAVGLVVWMWDGQASVLQPVRVHGYPIEVAQRLPCVRPDAENATAASFRTAETRVVAGGELASGAVVAPLLTTTGCVGVLAIELHYGDEQKASVRTLVTTLAAQLAISVESAGFAEVAEAVNT